MCIRDRLIVLHLYDHYAFYGELQGMRTARKHLGWYTEALPGGQAFRREMCMAESTAAQLAVVCAYFDRIAATQAYLPPIGADAGIATPTTTNNRHRAGEALAA